MSGQAGFNCVLKIGSNTLGIAENVELSATGAALDVTSRGSAGWKEFIQSLKEWDAAVDQLWVPTDAGLQAIRSAYFAGTQLAVQFLDSGGVGFSGNCLVTSMKRGEPIGGAVKLPVTLKGTGALTVVSGS